MTETQVRGIYLFYNSAYSPEIALIHVFLQVFEVILKNYDDLTLRVYDDLHRHYEKPLIDAEKSNEKMVSERFALSSIFIPSHFRKSSY